MMGFDPVIDPALVSTSDYSAMNAHLAALDAAGAGKTSFVASRVSRDLLQARWFPADRCMTKSV